MCFIADGVGCAKNGANMVLHHLGESTLSDIREVEKECVAAGAKTVIVGGDISNENTAKDVRLSILTQVMTTFQPCTHRYLYRYHTYYMIGS